MRAAWYHIALPYHKTSYNKGKLYRRSRVTKFDDINRKEEVEWDGTEGLGGYDGDDDEDEEVVMTKPQVWKMSAKEKKSKAFLEIQQGWE